MCHVYVVTRGRKTQIPKAKTTVTKTNDNNDPQFYLIAWRLYALTYVKARRGALLVHSHFSILMYIKELATLSAKRKKITKHAIFSSHFGATQREMSYSFWRKSNHVTSWHIMNNILTQLRALRRGDDS